MGRSVSALTFKVGGDTSGLKRAIGGAKGMLSGLGDAARGLKIGGASGQSPAPSYPGKKDREAEKTTGGEWRVLK